MSGTLILGLGGAGVKVTARLAKDRIGSFEYAVLDSDSKSTALAGDSATVISGGSELAWRDGYGCGGDIIRGEQFTALARQKIGSAVRGKDLVVVVAGLGGGLATGGIRTVASVLRNFNVPAVFMVTTPFSFESFARRKAAEDCVAELMPLADILLRIPNDLLFSMIPPNTTMDEAFNRSCEELARSAVGICGMLLSENSFNTDYAGFMAALKNRKALCGFGVGLASSADGVDRCSLAVRRMLESPFLGGVSKINAADALIVSLCAGKDLKLGEAKRALETVSALASPETSILAGFNTASYMGPSVQMLAVTIKYEDAAESVADDMQFPRQTQTLSTSTAAWNKPETETSPAQNGSASGEFRLSGGAVPAGRRQRKRKKGASDLEQGFLELKSFSKGIFTSVLSTMYGNIDLDVPTYQRNGITVDKGTNVR